MKKDVKMKQLDLDEVQELKQRFLHLKEHL